VWEFTRFIDIDYFEIEINIVKYIKNSHIREIEKNQLMVNFN